MKTRITFLSITALTIIASASSAQTALYTLPPDNLVQNGGFEQGPIPTDWGWSYNFGVAVGFPDAAEGNNYAEVYGTLSQILPTVAGQEYQLEFATSGNFNVPTVQVLNAIWNGTQVASVSWNPAGHDVNNLGWVWTTVDVTASSSSTALIFSNPYVGDATQRIPFIDAVSVVAVPEPSSVILFGLCGFALLRGRMKS